MESNDHNKIIRKVAKEILVPMGLVQKGQSRIWVDDNGWYFTVVEFQPSAYGKGSYLNVGVHFLWANRGFLSFDIGGREESFVEFNGDETQFYMDMLSLGEKAAVLVQKYRLFENPACAKEYILSNRITYSASWDLYHKMMGCGLAKEPEAVACYNKLMSKTAFSATPYEMEIYRELTENMTNLIEDADRLFDYVCGKIEQTRAFWRSKSGMRKLKG